MMTKSKSNYAAKLKVLLVAPVAFFLVVAFTVSPVVKTVAQVDKQTKKVEAKSQNPQEQAKEEVFTVVEVMPQFPGGEKALQQYLVGNIKYPEDARKKGVQGTTYVSFIVGRDGNISDTKVLRGFDKDCDQVALNVVKNMPKWESGFQGGKPVRVQFNMPIKFSLGDGDKKVMKGEENKPGTPPPPPPPPPQTDKK